MARPSSVISGHFFPTPERVVAALGLLLSRPAAGGRRVVRLLDPCAGTGAPAAAIGAALGAQTFGVELNEDRAAEARGRLDRVLCGDAFATRLSNGAFSVLFCNPPYHDDEEKLRLEHRFLQHLTRALCPGGLLVFLVPQRRLELSARYLANHYDRLAAWRFPDPEWAAFGQIVLVGAKRPWAAPDAAAERLVRAWSTEDLPVLPDGPAGGATLPPVPTVPAGEVLFASAIPDLQEAAAECRRAGAWALPQVTEALWPPDERPVRPLMPLKKAHLGALTASGFVNNTLLEHDGERVLVKGRTIKVLVRREGDDDRTIVERERHVTTITVLDLDTGELLTVGQGAQEGGDASAATPVDGDGSVDEEDA